MLRHPVLAAGRQVLYLLEKVLIFLPEALSQRWQYHSIGRQASCTALHCTALQ
jgi:hypothetical protein